MKELLLIAIGSALVNNVVLPVLRTLSIPRCFKEG